MLYKHRLSLTVTALAIAFAGCSALAAPVSDFAFLQVSDLHVSPQPFGSKIEDSRSVEAIEWVCQEAAQPQRLDPPGLVTPAPAFVMATGDLTEFGVIASTFDNFERYFKTLQIPLYITPGNHDNTWTSILPVMRRKHGGDHYSFDKFGCHFVSIDSATPQEPLPSLEQRTLTFLAKDLRKVAPATPVFIFCHHPLSTGEYAKPFEQLRFLETIEGKNVVLLLMGHGHGVRAERWGRLDSVMGGSTFGPNTGYSIISVHDGILRVAYRFKDPAKPMQALLEKRLTPRPGPALELLTPDSDARVTGDRLSLKARVRGAQVTKASADIDGNKENTIELTGKPGGQLLGTIPTAGLIAGAHYLRVTATAGEFELDRAIPFIFTPETKGPRSTRVVIDSGMKAGPILTPQDLIVATTSGELLRMPVKDSLSRPTSLLKADGEFLCPPAFVDGTLYAASGDGNVYAVSPEGRLAWKCPVGAAVYGTPAVANDAVYVGDLEGIVHASDRRSGKLLWSQRHARFSIEQGLLLHEGVLYFGAWDGFVYAVNAADGSLKWKSAGPQGQGKQAGPNRYYSPADCSPIIVGDRLFIADRAYFLGSYKLDGTWIEQVSDNIAAIGASPDGRRFYARGSGSGLTCYDQEGKKIWSNPVQLGRLPIPPTEVNGRVYACSGRGTLGVHDAATGELLWQYQVSPQLHIMSAVAVDARGGAFVTGMDGTITRVTP